MSQAQARIKDIKINPNVQAIAQVRKAWGDPWATLYWLQVQGASEREEPAISEAKFLFNYGAIQWPEHRGKTLRYRPIDLIDYYVRILLVDENGETPIWYGLFTDDSFKFHGPKKEDSGDQVITAFGLERILDRIVIDKAYCDENDMVGELLAGRVINRSPDFNERGEYDTVLGNRSTVDDPVYLAPVFSSDGNQWDNLHILTYILTFFNAANFIFKVSGQYQLLENIIGIYRFDGLTVRQALNKLIDRHRGLAWGIRVSEDEVYVHISSVFGQPIQVSEDKMLEPNPERVFINSDKSINTESLNVNVHDSQVYDKIVVAGDFMEACFSLSFAEESLAAGWSQALEDEYKDNPKSDDQGDPDYNDQARRSDRYRAVYQRLVISPAWVGSSYDGTKTDPAERNTSIPTLKPDGTIDTEFGAAAFGFGKKLLRYLPVKFDESNEFIPTLAIIPDPDTPTRYFQVDTPEGDEDRPAARVRVLDDEMGVEVRSKIGHVYGFNHFDLPTVSKDSNHEAVYDYEGLILTVNMQTDQRVRIERDVRTPGDNPRTLMLHVEGAKMQYIVPGTAIKIENGAIVSHAGGLVRDDTERLRLIAALASAWYGVPRASVKIKIKSLMKPVLPGCFITKVKAGDLTEFVGTIVTSISWDFKSKSPTTTVETSYWELDAAKIVEVPGIGSTRDLSKAVRVLERNLAEIKKQVHNFDDRRPAALGGSVALTAHSHVTRQWGLLAYYTD